MVDNQVWRLSHCNGVGIIVQQSDTVHSESPHSFVISKLFSWLTQLKRSPKSLPKLEIIRHPDDIFSYQYSDFKMIDYDCDDHIKAPVAV